MIQTEEKRSVSDIAADTLRVCFEALTTKKGMSAVILCITAIVALNDFSPRALVLGLAASISIFGLIALIAYIALPPISNE